MNIKLTAPDQVAQMRVGDMIKRFPFNSTDDRPLDFFDENQARHINTYEIRAIDYTNSIFSLVEANFRSIVCASAVDIGRLFIKAADLITEKVWWIDTDPAPLAK